MQFNWGKNELNYGLPVKEWDPVLPRNKYLHPWKNMSESQMWKETSRMMSEKAKHNIVTHVWRAEFE
jgi:hypothetical protein